MSYYHDHLYIKTPKQPFSRAISANLFELWKEDPTYVTQSGGTGNRNKDMRVLMKTKGFEIQLETEDVIDGVAWQHLDVIEYIMPAVMAVKGMKEIEFSGWMRVGCYNDGDCGYAEYSCKAGKLSVKKVCASVFEMDCCPHCGETFEAPLFTLKNYKPKKDYQCPHCNQVITAEYEQKSIDITACKQRPAKREIIYFGSYPQTDAVETERIEWIVLEKTEEKTLLLSKLGLHHCIYDHTSDEMPHVWHESNARKWLNEEFYTRAFSGDEKKHILETSLTDSLPHAKETVDKVFLLSNDEVRKYLAGGSDAKVIPTELEKTQKASPQWWTRSPGRMSCSASIVNTKGILDDDGMYFDDGMFLLRPAIWVSSK